MTTLQSDLKDTIIVVESIAESGSKTKDKAFNEGALWAIDWIKFSLNRSLNEKDE